MTNRVRLELTVTRELKAELKAEAKRRGLTLSALCNLRLRLMNPQSIR